jgi:mitochondrial GTPase 1
MMPFVPTVETFLSLALCGSIRDGIVPWATLADYLLYHLNLHNPELYAEAYSAQPTNDVNQFLISVAIHSGRLKKGGVPDEASASAEAVWAFRKGRFGAWPIDSVSEEGFNSRVKEEVLARRKELRWSVPKDTKKRGAH